MLESQEFGEIRIAIVSEQRVFGESLAFALNGQGIFSIDSVVQDPADAALRSDQLAVVIVNFEGLDALIEDAVSQLRGCAPRAGIIALAASSNPKAASRSVESGIDVHLTNEQGLVELCRAIVCVAGGIACVDPRPVARVSAALAANEPAVARLSAREHDVLRLLAEGYANRDIAIALNVAPKTVKNHVSNILSKLQSTSRTQAVIHALRRGIV